MSESANIIPQKIPILIRISTTIIIVMGIIGLIFFVTISIYQHNNPEVLSDISNNNIENLSLNWYIIIQALLHIGLIASALLIIQLRKIGLYMFLSVFIAMVATEFIFDNKLILNYLIVGLIIVFTVLLYYRKFK